MSDTLSMQIMTQEVLHKISKVANGFKPIEYEARKIIESNTVGDSFSLAKDLFRNEKYQIRCLAVFLLGFIASKNSEALKILKMEVSKDISWQVQEILAKSFDQYCNDIGYENSIPIIEEWLKDKNPNVCRAVTEGLRIWTSRPYFNANPGIAIKLISQHKSNDSEYLRKSVGNSLRDISKKYKELIDKEISTWDLSDKKINFTYKFVIKNRKK